MRYLRRGLPPASGRAGPGDHRARHSPTAVPARARLRRLRGHRLSRALGSLRADADERGLARARRPARSARRASRAGAGAGHGAAARGGLGQGVRGYHDARRSAAGDAGRRAVMSLGFRYRAATPDGQVMEGVLHAPSRQSVLEELRRQHLYPVTVDESTPTGAPRGGRQLGRRAAVTLWTRNAATLLGAGVPLDRALAFTAQYASHHGLAETVRQVRRAVQGGASLAGALARPETRRRWHAARLAWPWIGDLELKYSTARLARTLGLLLKSGVPALPALKIARASATNLMVQESVDRAAAALAEGSALAPSLAGTLPPLALQMIAVGEESGRLEDLCLRVADTYDGEVRRSLRTGVALLEPALIVIFGALVGFVALGMLQAIYGINLKVS